MKATNKSTKQQASQTLTARYGYYTDPILYEEGFFKDREEERAFLHKVEKHNQKVASLDKKKLQKS